MDQKEIDMHMLNMHRTASELEHELDVITDRILLLRQMVSKVRVSTGAKLKSQDETPKSVNLPTDERIHALLGVNGDMPAGSIARTLGIDPDVILNTLRDSRYFKKDHKTGRWGLKK